MKPTQQNTFTASDLLTTHAVEVFPWENPDDVLLPVKSAAKARRCCEDQAKTSWGGLLWADRVMKAHGWVLLIAALVYSGPGIASEADHWLAEDKAQHAAVGAILGVTGRFLVEELIPDAPRPVKFVVALLPAIAAGALKEAYDYRNQDEHTPDARDFVATAAGGALGALSVELVWHF